MATSPISGIDKSVLTRILPPLAFALALCLLVVLCYDSGYTGLPPTEKRYVSAKSRISTLKNDAKKNILREPWEKLAQEFQSIYDSDPNWPNRPAALFRAAESLEELAARSCSRADAKKAISCYETLALRHASSRLADDALFRAARLRAASLRDEKGALALLTRIKQQYPKGDMLKDAQALEKALLQAAKGKPAPETLASVNRDKLDVLEDQPAKQSQHSKKANFKGDLLLRFKAAQSRMGALEKDSVRTCWRQPWEELREEFLQIAKAGKTRLSAQAEYQAAVCQQKIAFCSKLSADAKKACDMFLAFSRDYPGNDRADDALLAAAKLQRSQKGAKADSIRTLDKLITSYGGGDKAREARTLRSGWSQEDAPLSASAAKKTAPPKKETPELQVLSWDTPAKNRVEIVLEMSAPARYSTRMEKASKASPARIYVDLPDATIIKDVRNGVTVSGSLLQAVRVKDLKGGGSSLQFDFRDARKFDTRMEDDPCRIILSVAAGNAKLPATTAKTVVADKKGMGADRNFNARQVSNMASQLGLTVQKVFIDAGHGGKDPGTSHNKVLEREATLDIAQRLGRLLKANGLEVVYSRQKDIGLPLSHRPRLANASKADLFVSIHINAHHNPAINGIETYYLNLANNKHAAQVAMLENAGSDRRLGDMQGMLAEVMLNARVDESRRMAADIQRLCVFRLKKRNFQTKDNGVKSAPFHVLIGAQMPAVLVEVGYCTNAEEARQLASAQYRHALAEGLAEGILAYKDRLLKNRTARNHVTADDADPL